MASPELGEQHLRGIVDQVLHEQSQSRPRKKVNLERRRNYRGFIEKAGELLESYGEDQESRTGNPPNRLTRPVEMKVGEETIQIQVARFISTYHPLFHRERLAIVIDFRENGRPGIFEIEQTHSKSVDRAEIVRGEQARNQWDRVATDAEVAGAYHSLLWLEEQLQRS